MMENKTALTIKIIKKVKPENYKKIINYKGSLVDDGLLDSFDIMKICSEIETISKKKISPKKLKKLNFSNLDKIAKLI
jgi:acyl carrier protein